MSIRSKARAFQHFVLETVKSDDSYLYKYQLILANIASIFLNLFLVLWAAFIEEKIKKEKGIGKWNTSHDTNVFYDWI